MDVDLFEFKLEVLCLLCADFLILIGFGIFGCHEVVLVFLRVELEVELGMLLIVLVENCQDVDQTYQAIIVKERLEAEHRVVRNQVGAEHFGFKQVDDLSVQDPTLFC